MFNKLLAELLLRDMSYASTDITLDLSGLAASTKHDITIFSYDDAFDGAEHTWYESSTSGTLLKTITPITSDAQTGFFTVSNIVSSVSGTIRIVGSSSAARYFNGMVVGVIPNPPAGTVIIIR